MEELLSVDEFAEKIKSKYPQYASMDNLTLAQKIIDKYPQYKNQVDMSMVSTDVAVEEAPEVDIAQNNAIINSTMVDETPFTELSVENQEKYITKSGNYATDKDGNLLFVPRNKQEADEVWNYPKDSSGRRYFPDMPVVETETDVVEEEKSSENIFDLSRSGVRGTNRRDPNVELLSTYVLGNSEKSTVNVNGQRVLPGNIKKDAKDIEVSVEDETLNLLNINKQDYVNWERENFRKEDKAFGFIQGLRTDSSEKKAIDKRNAEKLSAYLLTLGNSVEKDLKIVQAKLKSTTDPAMRAQLLADEEILKTDLFNNLNSRIKLVNTNDYLRNEKESQVELNKETFLKGQSEGPVSYVASGIGNRLKDAWNVAPTFFGGILRIPPSLLDQGLSIAGADDKGFLAATDEALGSLQDFISFDVPERSAFVDGKKVYSVVNGQNHPFIVTKDGRIIDEVTHVDMEGILTDTQYQSILKGAEGEETETFASAGGFAQNFTSTLVNLFALVRSGQWITKGLNKALKKGGSKTTVGGGVGMGAASYASTAVGEVEDIRATLVRSGMSEKEAMKYAIAAGNSRATLDGIFSGLAGSNVKLLGTYKNVSKSIIDIAKKPSSWAKKGVFQQKVKDLVKENAKELFVEELPVLYTGKGINALVNYTLEEDVLNDRASNAEFYETVAMTLGATSSLGGNVLLRGNSRSSLIDIASHAPDLKKTIDKLVAQDMITKQEGVAAYDEIYAMQIANNNSNGAVMMPANKVKYSDLAAQRKDLVEQEKNLEGPGKERVRKKIEAIDAELETLIVKDEAEVLKETKKVPEKSSNLETEEVTVTEEEVIEEIKKRKPNSNVYTEEELKSVREKLIKEKQDALQKSSTESVDVQQPSGDGKKVGEGDVGTVTEPSNQKNQDASQEKSKKKVVKPLPQKPLLTPKERQSRIVSEVIKKTKARKVGTDTNPKIIADNVIGYLQGSKLYEESTDSEREVIIQDINKKLGVDIKPPTVKKLLGIKRGGKPAFIKVKNDFAAYKKQLKADEKLQSYQKKDIKEKRITLSNVLSGLKKAGRITLGKFDILQKKINKVNVYNARDLQSVTDYVEKVINDANAAKKIRDADSLRRRIKKDAKKSSVSANVSIAAQEFVKIDPNMVDDIDAYLEQASILLDGLKPTKRTTKGIKVTRGVNIKKTNNYSSKELNSQQQKVFTAQRLLFQELTGLNSNEFTMVEMKKILGNLKSETELTSEAKEEKIKTKKTLVEKGLKNAFEKVKKDLKQIINNAIDPLTGESVKLTQTERKLANEFLNMDLSILKDTKAKMEALDALINFATNQDTGGMDAVLNKYMGLKGMAEVNEKGYVATSLKTIFGGNEVAANLWNKYLGALPTTIEKLFNSPGKARYVMDKMGLTELFEGSSKAVRVSNDLIDDYAKKFKKLKMKSGIYFDENNSIERGIFAEMRRTIPGNEQDIVDEFNRSKKLIKETYETLEKQKDKDLKREGKIIKEIYNKILKDANNINEVENKVDPINVDGVKYFTEIWASNYDQLAEVNLNVYNANLGKEINYTPTSYRKLSFEEKTPEIGTRVFNPSESKKSAYDEKTGVLKPATRPTSLPGENKRGKKVITRVLNLGFDLNNTNQLEKALIDIYTAPAIKKIEGARSSEYYDKIFPSESDKKMMDDRINLLVDKKRGVSERMSEQDKRILNSLNKVATLGVARVLGGVFQPIKQQIVLINAAIVGGFRNVSKGVGLLYSNPDVEKAIINSGMAIANRGVQSQADINPNSLEVKNKDQKYLTLNPLRSKALDKMSDLGKWWINTTLVKSDVFAARASWIGFYLQSMKKKGIESSEIDWTQPLNKESARDAQYELDRQQNVSDADLMGELFSSNKFTPQLIRKMVFPFASFLINQKNRMYSDILIARNPTALPGERGKALRSLAGLFAETTSFNAVGYGITQLLSALAGSVFGEDEEEKERRKGYQMMGRGGMVLTDLASPIPILDDATLGLVNKITMSMQSEDEKDPFQFFTSPKDFIDLMGTLGIAYDKATKMWDMIKAGYMGEVSSKYAGKTTTKEIPQKAQDVMKTVSLFYFLYNLGLMPAETGYISERILKQAKKQKEKKPIIITPPKKKSKRPKPSGGPTSPFKKRRRKTGPTSPF